MKTTMTWQRLNPDTLSGERLKVTIVYSSFDAREIDELQNTMPGTFVVYDGSGESEERK